MTAKQIENAIYEWQSFVADKINDIHAFATAIRNPEDYVKNNRNMAQIENAIADIRNAQTKIEELEDEVPESEDSSNDYTGNSFLNNLKRFG